MVAAVSVHAIVAAARHGGSEPGGVGIEQPRVHPFFLDRLVKGIGVGVWRPGGKALAPDFRHDAGGNKGFGVGFLDRVFKTFPMPLYPGGSMAVQAYRLQGLAPLVHLRLADKKFCGIAPLEIGGQGLAILVAYHGGVRLQWMRVGINQTKNTPWETVVHLVGSFGDDVTVLVDQQADVTRGTGRRRKILTDGPGNGIEIPALLMR